MRAHIENGCFWVDVAPDHRLGYLSELNMIRLVKVSTDEIVMSEVVEKNWPAYKFMSEILYYKAYLSLN